MTATCRTPVTGCSMRRALSAGLAGAALLTCLEYCPGQPTPESTAVSWKKRVIDHRFRSEGVAVGDVNRDGRPDILVGDVWYEAPEWTPHEIRPVKDYGDGSKGYSQCFLCWADDINRDGWPDEIVVAFPVDACFW